MGLFHLSKAADINEGIKEMQKTEDAILLDVRSREEYGEAHIPGSMNLPVMELMKAESLLPKKDAPLFVYCLSGARSARAVKFLQKQGYTNVHDLGGMCNYNGRTETGSGK